MKTQLVRLVPEIAILLTFAASLFFYIFVSPYKRGFHCQDGSIRYPYKQDTVSDAVLIIVSIVLPFSLIVITEIARRKVTIVCNGEQLSWKHVCLRSYDWVVRYLVGLVTVILVVSIGKIMIGRLRPHFMAVCQPVGFNCTRPDEYVTEYSCTTAESLSGRLEDARMSWPSGHGGLSLYCALFLILYLHRKPPVGDKMFPGSGLVLLIPVVQILCLTWGVCVSLSRITDNKHHWSDVLSGNLIGALSALFAVFVRTSSHYVGYGDLEAASEESQFTSVHMKLKESSTENDIANSVQVV